MAIFPQLMIEDVVQVGDKTRLDAEKSFITDGEAALTTFTIDPEAGAIDVLSKKYLDWVYDTAGTKTITVTLDNGGTPKVLTKTITVISEADDMLISSDADLVKFEDDILKYVRKGRSSFLDKHRTARDRILTYLDEKRIFTPDGGKITKSMLPFGDTDFRDWSTFLCLQIIYESLSNAVNDVFDLKAKKYASMVEFAANRAVLRFDFNDDQDTSDPDEQLDGFSYTLVRR